MRRDWEEIVAHVSKPIGGMHSGQEFDFGSLTKSKNKYIFLLIICIDFFGSHRNGKYSFQAKKKFR